MLRKIPVHYLRVGMYVQEVCGSWLSHPFWRSSFALTDERHLARLQASVSHVVIDTDKGIDIDEDMQDGGPTTAESMMFDDVEVHAPADAAAAPVAWPSAVTGNGAGQTEGFVQEIERASKIVTQARGAMQSMFQDIRLGRAIDTQSCLPLVQDITQSVHRNPSAIISLARLKTKDDYTYMHSVAVCALMVALARQMGMGEDDARQAGLAGLVHDLGKALMPQDILNKPGALSTEEFSVIKGHPEAGHALLLEGGGVGHIPLDVCLHHHEKMNGSGYPHRLKGDEITLFARMGAVCDVYDAITSNRPYKAGWEPSEAVQKMAQWAREGHFDESVFHRFVKSVGIYPVGSLVRLKSDRLAVVIEPGASSLLQPKVKLVLSAHSRQPLPHELLDLSQQQDEIVSRESPDEWGLSGLEQLWLPAA